MRRMIQKHLAVIVVLGMLVSIVCNYVVQIQREQCDMEEDTAYLFWQIRQILAENELQLHMTKNDFKNSCLTRAKAAAYMVQQQPDIVKDSAELNRIAKLLQVDELHVFDKTGTIYAGTEPRYWGYQFQSGEQMQYFLPMLKDRSLELCQDMMPNTAENRLMQYAAVWQENGENIIQIGMTPTSVLESTKHNELSHIFSVLTDDNGVMLFAVDAQDYTVLGSNKSSLVGKSITASGLQTTQLDNAGKKGFYADVLGKHSYCVFIQYGKVILGRACPTSLLYRHVNESALFLVISLFLVCMAMLWASSSYLNRTVVRSIEQINSKLQTITNGNLGEQVAVCTTPEFTELSGHINQMVQSLLKATGELSDLLKKQQVELDEDPLTGLCSRRAFYARMDELFAAPQQLKHAALIMVDSDNLKYINDTQGHAMGDLYLQGIANVLRTITAEHQVISRLSGDEFAVFLYGCNTRETLEVEIGLLQEKCNGDLRFSAPSDIAIYFSMGCAYYPEDDTDYHMLLKLADQNMYVEKWNRKNNRV